MLFLKKYSSLQVLAKDEEMNSLSKNGTLESYYVIHLNGCLEDDIYLRINGFKKHSITFFLKQKSIPLSSMEAEYIAASEAAKSIVWLERPEVWFPVQPFLAALSWSF